MGIFSNLMGGFFQSKEEESMKAKKIIEIKESRIKEGRNLEKGLDEFVDFLDEYKEDWIDVQDLIKCYKKTVEPTTKRLANYNNITGTYGIKEIELAGFDEFKEKDGFISIYMNYKKMITECRIAFVSEKEIREELEKKVDEFDGTGFEEFEDIGYKIITKSLSAVCDLNKYFSDDIDDLEKNVICHSYYKDKIIKRLKREGFDSLSINNKTSDSGITARLNEKYAKKKRSKNKDWQPKTFKS